MFETIVLIRDIQHCLFEKSLHKKTTPIEYKLLIALQVRVDIVYARKYECEYTWYHRKLEVCSVFQEDTYQDLLELRQNLSKIAIKDKYMPPSHTKLIGVVVGVLDNEKERNS